MEKRFTLKSKDAHSRARTGVFKTDHGDIQTPIFMPVGTVGSVKAVSQEDLVRDVQADIILGNTYHLYLRPGLDIIQKAGGLHKFIHWDRPMLTDSGGFQVYSLSDIRKINEEGVNFRSHIDGSKHFFTPEYAIDVQRRIGADIIMAFDECTPYPCDYGYARSSMELTHRWLDRCLEQFKNTEGLYGYEQFLFPIIQGSTYKDLRKISAEYCSEKDVEGVAIGGLSVGEPAEEMYEMTELVTEYMPEDKPRYLMGVGTPANILECIALGVDMFDCVMPTRNARNGMLFTQKGTINMRNKKWEDDFTALDPDGESHVDQFYSKAYVKHLYKANEILALQIGSLHNLSFYLWLVREARKHIELGDFLTWKNKMVPQLSQRL